MLQHNDIFDKISSILENQTPLMDCKMLKAFVKGFIDNKHQYLDAYQAFGSPLYLIDEQALLKRAHQFSKTFQSYLPKVEFFYAMKSNHHPFLIKTLSQNGFGIDVSSEVELKKALDCGAKSIIFSGPAKMDSELKLALAHSDKVIILMDSFSELKKLEEAASKLNVKIKTGIRLTVEEYGLWKKFGIPLSRLNEFFKEAEKCRYVDLRGLQFHTSWNLTPEKQVAFLSRLSQTLQSMDQRFLKQIEFTDIGGGYWPEEGEWLHPSVTTEGRLQKSLEPEKQLKEGLDHRHLPSMPINDFAKQIASALETCLFRYTDCTVFMEPGRWICHPSMHILLQVIDKKDKDLIVTDGATNILGWERLETDYFPVINLTRPSLDEKECLLCGSLCTPHDIWGYSYFGDSIEEGDILFIPTQGAYTYSLRQNFIKPLPKEAVLTGRSAYLLKQQ